MKKNRMITNSLRTILKSVPRFLSLMIMSMLGVFVFAGLQATSPDMIQTLDTYLDNSNVYDIKIISSMGLLEEDISCLQKVEGIEEVEGSHSVDVLIKGEEEYVVHISSIPKNINTLSLIEGRYPENWNEIVVEPNLLTKNHLKIGDTLSIENEDLKEDTYQIVGTVESPIYFNSVDINQTRGTTSIGSGTVHYYAYLPEDSFSKNDYTSIYLTVRNAKEEITSSKNYIQMIEKVLEKLDSIKEERELARYENILSMLPSSQSSIIKPNWYFYDREDDTTYNAYIEDSNSIRNLSKLFPVIFFAVAILVSLISMNRMVEDDRLEIGTLKSLGFSNRHILKKYLLFSLSATILGGMLGSILGIIIIPTLIFHIYSLLFTIPNLQLGWNIQMTLLGFILSALCICGTTVFTVWKVLKENPAQLMRVKAPKKGKRVFLEKQKWIWHRLSFSNKVTIRNLFRYKKRVIVTIGGIAGCTALMLCGFGIKDSIVDIADMQYQKTYQFDAMVYVNQIEETTKEEISALESVQSMEEAELINATVEDISVTMFITEPTDLEKIVHLVDTETKEEITLKENEVAITDKLADLLDIEVGDTIQVVDVNHESYTYQVSKIVKNYIGHSIYLSKENYPYDYEPNVLYLHTLSLSEEEKNNLSTKLLENDSVIQVTYSTSFIDSVTDMLSSLDKVVAILIVLAAMLSFVVLYNLSNINIQERKREIATLKVLGFYSKEVDSYITKETIFLTFLGIGLGLIGGYFLTNMLITTVEIEKARFIHHIRLESYLYASLIAILFTLIVNRMTHFTLKKIDMIESLKSVE